MRLLTLFSFLLFCSSVMSEDKAIQNNQVKSEDICHTNHKKFDIQMQGPIKEKFRCPMYWSRGKFREGMEFAFFKKGCRRYEGGPRVDCFQMRTCSNKPGFKPSWGAMFYLDGKGQVQNCKLGKTKSLRLIGNSYESPKKDFSATIPCDYPIKYIVYSNPKKEKKICSFPPML
ncbi:MAG: hypothetical protein NXH75_10250 [Halobacteriovoraceae bacterium]|nr:hypothetical protein [Halobacteriovoraceae bacterium]